MACCIALTSLDTISTTLEAEFNELHSLPEVQAIFRAPWVNPGGSSTCAWFRSLGTPDWSRIYLSKFEKHAILWHDVKKPPSAENEIQISYFSTKRPYLLSSSLIFIFITHHCHLHLILNMCVYLLFLNMHFCFPQYEIFLMVLFSPHLSWRPVSKYTCSVECFLMFVRTWFHFLICFTL